MDALVYINDEFVPGKEAKISALDLSVLRGFGVVDYLRTYGGAPFQLRKHIDRFIASAQSIGLTPPKKAGEMEKIVWQLLKRTHFEETSVKFVLTGGVSPDQFLPQGLPTFFVIAYPFIPFSHIYYERGIQVITKCHHRTYPEAKTIQYLPAILGMQEAQKEGAVDVLFYNEKGHLLESAIANFFAVKGERIFTPKEGILKGVTRDLVLSLVPVEECTLFFDEIPTFDGAFLTSSNKEVMPVVQIDNYLLSGGEVLPIVREVMERFANCIDAPLQSS